MSVIIQLYPNNNPTPPCIPFLLRLFKRILAIWRTAMSKAYSDTLPVIIPAHWTVDRILYFADGGAHPKPEYTAAITRLSNVRRGIGQLGAAA